MVLPRPPRPPRPRTPLQTRHCPLQCCPRHPAYRIACLARGCVRTPPSFSRSFALARSFAVFASLLATLLCNLTGMPWPVRPIPALGTTLTPIPWGGAVATGEPSGDESPTADCRHQDNAAAKTNCTEPAKHVRGAMKADDCAGGQQAVEHDNTSGAAHAGSSDGVLVYSSGTDKQRRSVRLWPCGAAALLTPHTQQCCAPGGRPWRRPSSACPSTL